MIDTRFNEKSNILKAEIFQSTCQININTNKLTLFIVQRSKYCATNTLIRVNKKKPLSIIKIYNPSKNLLSKYTKVTKIATLINNIVKKLANIYELQTKPIKHTIKFLVNIYSHNKYFLLNRLKRLKDKRNMPIFLFFIDKM